MRLNAEEFNIEFMKNNGFIRKKCKICSSHFWTQKHDLEVCMESPCTENQFIMNTPAKIKVDINKMREVFLNFFKKNSHEVINPYPVVARWRDDLLVTIASIVDFQPYVTNGIISPPANPLVISQPCLRFEDIDYVGLTSGRHLTIFEMGGAHAFNYPDKTIYWKNETIEYHHRLLTEELKVPSDLVTYKEHFWSGGGNAGPDVEAIVLGIEISTLVFMEYTSNNGRLIPTPVKTVDTGYGIERWAWLSMGSPTAFHAIYGNLLQQFLDIADVSIEEKILIESGKVSSSFIDDNKSKFVRDKVAKKIGLSSSDFESILGNFESICAVLDHTKALVFMLSEGVVPSNVKVGYLARMLLRRSYRLLSKFNVQHKLIDLVEKQIKYWKNHFLQINDMREEIVKMTDVEIEKYVKTLDREFHGARKTLESLKNKKVESVPIDVLQELYESHGLHPHQVVELSKEVGIKTEIPSNFFSALAYKKASQIMEKKIQDDEEKFRSFQKLPPTELIYYKKFNEFNFNANVLRSKGKFLVLDRTAFYPEGGGQLGDQGIISWNGKSSQVTRSLKTGRIVVHVIEGPIPSDGVRIKGEVDSRRRRALSIHHTATHIINGAARHVLGEHIWQAGASKDVNLSRLDITHYAHLLRKEILEIENQANMIVRKNLPVEILLLPRNEAEKEYGFRLYQGGIVPGKEVRVIKIGNWDIEACGGTHLQNTGEIGSIKIVRVERIQDGVERIEFVAGQPAIKLIQKQENTILAISEVLGTQTEKITDAVNKLVVEKNILNKKQKLLFKKLSEVYYHQISGEFRSMDDIRVYFGIDSELGDEFQIIFGERCIKEKPASVYCVIIKDERVVKVITFSGKFAQSKGIRAKDVAKEISKILGGSGGGDDRFGRGGGPIFDNIPEAKKFFYSFIEKVLFKKR
jgi:alanyl-tRNA synthetase